MSMDPSQIPAPLAPPTPPCLSRMVLVVRAAPRLHSKPSPRGPVSPICGLHLRLSLTAQTVPPLATGGSLKTDLKE